MGQRSELVFNVTDDKGEINVLVPAGLPAGSTLVPSPKSSNTIQYTFTWDVQDVTDVALSFQATDELEATSVYNVQVSGCGLHRWVWFTQVGVVYTGGCDLQGWVWLTMVGVAYNGGGTVLQW